MKTISVYSYKIYDHDSGFEKIAPFKATEDAISDFQATKVDKFGRYKPN